MTSSPTTPLSIDNLSDADYRRMVETVADYAICALDVSGKVLSWNTGARAMNGYEAGEIIGRDFSVFYPHELRERREAERDLEAATKGGRVETEGWRLRKDGSRFWASVVITRLSGPSGELHGFSMISRDLSERRRQEEQLRLSEERFRLLVEGVKDYAIFMLDPEGHIASWNAGAQQTKGYTAAEIIGQHFSVFYPPEVTARGWPAEELQIALRDGRLEDEGWRVRKDGSRFWASVVITALRDTSGRHRGFAKVTRDLTERRRITALEDEGRRITTFLAMLGHELRNPLAPISSALMLLEHESAASPGIRQSREIIARQLRQLTRLVDDLLDVGRITSGKVHLEFMPMRLQDVLLEAVEAVQPFVDAKAQSLVTEVAVGDPWIQGDRARIVQVLANLLNNAAKFTPAGGRIVANLSQVNGEAQISVRDNGPGIPHYDLQRVFDLFVQGEQDVARSQGGLGLGLSLVQQLVTLHGGSVSAFSKGVAGEGSEFIVQLPTVPPPDQPMQPPPMKQAKAPAVQGKVLVVDDNRDAAETMSTLLDLTGYECAVAYDGASAIDIIHREKPAVVLIDLGLPGMGGVDVARRVRAEASDPPAFIAVTGYGQEQDRQITAEAGFHAHFTKPVDFDRLGEILQQLLAARARPAG